MFSRETREDRAVQQNLYVTPLGSLVCEDCQAAAAGSGTEGDPYVIVHQPDCQFALEAVPPRPPGRHRAPVSRWALRCYSLP